jgi:hypothetical protein
VIEWILFNIKGAISWWEHVTFQWNDGMLKLNIITLMFYISVKLPQIIKIVNGKSGEGISMASVIFELVAISATLSYGYAKSFPFR